MRREHFAPGFGPVHPYGPGADVYGGPGVPYGPAPAPYGPYGPGPYGYGDFGGYGHAADHYADEYYSHMPGGRAHAPYHFNPWHYPKPPQTEAEADKSMGPEEAFFHRKPKEQEEEPKPSGTAKKGGQKSNYATAYLGAETTPYEFAHPEAIHHDMVMLHGKEHHPAAHFEEGYWNLRDHQPHLYDEGHFAGEEHGAYHYVEPALTHHMGHYYSYEDDREHYPQHVDEHHNVHGIEIRPDDWRSDHHTIWHPDTYHVAPGHASHHSIHGDDYNHDVNYHDGHALMGQIEHEYDELFHELEGRTLHGVEHKTVHYPEMSITARDIGPQHGIVDYRDAPRPAGSHSAADYRDVKGGYGAIYSAEKVGGGYDHHPAGNPDLARSTDPVHFYDGHTSHSTPVLHATTPVTEVHETTTVIKPANDAKDSAENWLPYGDAYLPTHAEHHSVHGDDYNHDVNYHDGHALMGQIEHEYDELYHELEGRTLHGVEHTTVHYPEHSVVQPDVMPRHGIVDYRDAPRPAGIASPADYRDVSGGYGAIYSAEKVGGGYSHPFATPDLARHTDPVHYYDGHTSHTPGILHEALDVGHVAHTVVPMANEVEKKLDELLQ